MVLSIPDWQPRAPLQAVRFDWAEKAAVELAVLRLDLLDPLISGNKWFKLRPYLQQAQQLGAAGVISLGGAHSNHLHALAAAGQRFGFATVGLLRGDPQETPTVADLRRFGMQLHWLGYGGYRARHEEDFKNRWLQRYPGFYLIAEGGSGALGASGCAGIVQILEAGLPEIGWSDYDALWLAVGTGTTLAGLLLAEAGRHPLYGARVVPAGYGVESRISQTLQQAGVRDSGYCLFDACRGAYGRIDEPLAQLIRNMDADGQFPVEACYTGKALLALSEQVRDGFFARGTRLVFLHTGGMQGRRAQQPGLQEFAGPVPQTSQPRCAIS